MTYQAPYIITEPAKTIPQETFLLPICTTPERFNALWAALVQGGWTMFGQSVGDHNIDVLRALAYINDPTGGLCDFDPDPSEEPPTAPPIEQVVREVVRHIYTSYPEIVEEETQMLRPTYQKFNGQWYAGFPCGDCGGLEWVPLGSGAPIDPTTNAPLGADAIPPAIPVDPGLIFQPDGTETTNGTCYLDKATDLITARLKDFFDGVFVFPGVGLPGLTPWETVTDIYQLGQAIVSNEAGIDDILNLGTVTADDLKTLVDDADFQNRLRASIADVGQGPYSRSNLLVFMVDAQGLLFGVDKYLGTFLKLWASTVNVARLNEELAIEASACARGVIVPGTPLFTTTELLIDSTEYILLDVGPVFGETLPAAGSAGRMPLVLNSGTVIVLGGNGGDVSNNSALVPVSDAGAGGTYRGSAEPQYFGQSISATITGAVANLLGYTNITRTNSDAPDFPMTEFGFDVNVWAGAGAPFDLTGAWVLYEKNTNPNGPHA